MVKRFSSFFSRAVSLGYRVNILLKGKDLSNAAEKARDLSRCGDQNGLSNRSDRWSLQPTSMSSCNSRAFAKSVSKTSRRKRAPNSASEVAKSASRFKRRLKASKLAEPKQTQPPTSKAFTCDIPG